MLLTQASRHIFSKFDSLRRHHPSFTLKFHFFSALMNQVNGVTSFFWNPQDILSKNLDGKYAILILNQPAYKPVAEGIKYVYSIWKNASFRVAVDGGANILNQIEKINPEIGQFLPDVISGDFDSVKPEVLNYYENKGVKIIHTPCQDRTDLTKALQLTQQTCKQLDKKLTAIFVLSHSGGRFDHLMGNIESLFLAREWCDIPVYLTSDDHLTWLLLPNGINRIQIRTNRNGGYCGLIPIGQPSNNVTTTGLRWNLNNGKLAFGSLVSTSNQLLDVDEVTVQSENPLLWTMSLTEKCTTEINGIIHSC